MAEIDKGIFMVRSNNPLKRILDLPPIDFAALAAQTRTKRTKGFKHTPASLAKMKTGMAKARKAKRRAKAIAAIQADPPKPKRHRPFINAMGTMLDAMEWGHWYGRTDMQTLSGLKRGTIACKIILAERRGLIERIENPAWNGPRWAQECRFLYRRLEQQVAQDVGDEGKGQNAAAD